MHYVSTLPFELGQTLKGTDADGNLVNQNMEGAVFCVPDPRSGAKGHPLIVMCVRNMYQVASTYTALLGKRYGLLKNSAGYDYAAQVVGYSATLAGAGAVAIDDQLPSTGVAAKDLFWVILKGYHTVLTDNAGTGLPDIAIGDPLIGATAAGSTTSVAGRVAGLTVATAQATNAALAAINVLARALSARTTGETSTNLLTYVRNGALL